MNALGTESYSTVYRDTGTGFIHGVCKIAGVCAPAVVYYLYETNLRYPFLLISFLDFMALFAINRFPIDLTQKPML